VPHLGAHITLENSSSPAEHALFNERGARAIVSVAPGKLAAVLDTARQYGVGAQQLGKATGNSALRIEYQGHAVIDSTVDSLRDVWANSLERTLTSR
jgi:phosphoribosylformylglycinamidine (FGAM) synthase-like enzyme